MLQEHSAILSNCIKLSSVFKSFILFIFEWLLKISFTVKHKIVMLRNLLTFSLKGESVSLKSVSMKRQYRLNIKKMLCRAFYLLTVVVFCRERRNLMRLKCFLTCKSKIC